MGTADDPSLPEILDDDDDVEEADESPSEQPQTPEQRLATAYHEAGHVIVAHEQDIYVRGVSIKGRDGYAMPDDSDSEEFLRVLCAGRVAELRHAPDEIDEANRGAIVDEYQLSGAVERMGVTTDRLERLRSETVDIVKRRWSWIESLVQVLLKASELDDISESPLSPVLDEITGKHVKWLGDDDHESV